MVGLIPFFEAPILEIGPVVIDPWATLVAVGFILGLEMARARGIREGLAVPDVVDGTVFTVGMGFVVGHLVHVLAYNPHQIAEQGVMALLRIWAGFSSTGGFLGAVLGSVLFYTVIRKRPFWPHADAIMFGFPFGWTFGRLGCFMAHDHIGRPTDFFLAVDFPGSWGGPRHDLGLYEALWTAGIALTFWLLRNRSVRPGFFLGMWCFLYAPARFGMEFLRNTDLAGADVRWLGLTPAQYGALLTAVAGLWLVRRGTMAAPDEESVADTGASVAS
ncbi:MAG: prolipoprotein diacylglyceryl transferase [Myxococcota bacterium]|jgi:phosphatidylglycerol:prolipoprotein diacylglycerol transferase|nr:prolipoprotein diacylglyceryl transferase [Myxococcota bacterium]